VVLLYGVIFPVTNYKPIFQEHDQSVASIANSELFLFILTNCTGLCLMQHFF